MATLNTEILSDIIECCRRTLPEKKKSKIMTTQNAEQQQKC